MARKIKMIWRSSSFAVLITLFLSSGITSVLSDEANSVDRAFVDPVSSQEVLGANWHESDVRPNRKWTTESFDAEVALYTLLRSHNILQEGETARAVLSPFIGVMDGPFDAPAIAYWVGSDMISAAPRLRSIIAEALVITLFGQSDAWNFDTDVVLLEIERPGLWDCIVGKGCYPESLITTTRPLEINEADASYRRLHEIDKVSAVVKSKQ